MDRKTRALGLGVGVAIALFAAGGAAEEVETLRGSALSNGHPPLDVVVIRGTEVGGAVPEPRPTPAPAPAPAQPAVQNVTILIAPAPSPSVPVVWGGYGFVRRHDHRSVWRPGPRSWKHRPGHHHGSGHRVRGSAAIGAARVSFSHR
jgi:hypothetical protein